MKTENTLLLIVAMVLFAYFVVLTPMQTQTQVNPQSFWWIDTTFNGWKLSDGTYTTNLYDGDTISGISYTLTYRQSYEGMGPPTSWKLMGDIKNNAGSVLRTFTNTGTGLPQGQPVTVTAGFPSLTLTATGGISYYPTDVYVTGCSNQLPCCSTSSCSINSGPTILVNTNEPHFNVDYYTVSATSAKLGDTVTVSYSVTNTGRASGRIGLTIYADKMKTGSFWPYDPVIYTKSTTLDKSTSLSDTATFTVTSNDVSDDNIIRVNLDINGGFITASKQITYIIPVYSLMVMTIPQQSLVTINGNSINSGTSGAVFTLNGGTYNINVAKDKYYQKTVALALTENIELLISLNPIEYNIQFNTTPLSTIQVKATGVNIVKTADANGTAVFQLMPDTYAVTITKQGYTTKTTSITVNNNATYEQTLVQGSTSAPSTPKSTPGFELITLLISLIAAYLLLRRKHGKNNTM